MRLPPRFHLHIMGDTLSVLQRENIQPDLGRRLALLLSGQEVPDDFLRGWGVQVVAKEDSDQCERA